jgi:DNA-binding FrmR family transcriptional regulator
VILHLTDQIWPLDNQPAPGYYGSIPTPLGGGKLAAQSHVFGKEDAMDGNENTLRRLRIVQGHLKGVIRMVEQGEYCIDVIRQIQAVEAALNKTSTQILENHLNSCVTTAIKGNNPRERERVLREITEVFEMSTKV